MTSFKSETERDLWCAVYLQTLEKLPEINPTGNSVHFERIVNSRDGMATAAADKALEAYWERAKARPLPTVKGSEGS